VVETTRAWAHELNCSAGMLFNDLLARTVEPILDRLASYFVVEVDMQMDLGDWNHLIETGCGGGQCRFSAIRFLVVGIMPNAFDMQTSSTKSAVWVSAVEFLCTFCKSSDGASLTTSEHLVRI
jgi:hypothetical protein